MSFEETFSEEVVENPIQFYFEWKGGQDTAAFTYYDKSKEERIKLKNLSFVVLADRNTVKGFDEANSCGIYANEVQNLNFEEMHVKSFKGGEIAKGLWAQIKPAVAGRGGKFCKAVYAVMLNEKKGTCAPVCIQLYGSALAPWFEGNFRKSPRVVHASVDGEVQTKGATKYYQPQFVKGEVPSDKELKAKVNEQAKFILDYLKSKDEATKASATPPHTPAPATEQAFEAERNSFAPNPPMQANPQKSDNETDDLPF